MIDANACNSAAGITVTIDVSRIADEERRQSRSSGCRLNIPANISIHQPAKLVLYVF
jgi:hypothetical protein